jgi:ribose transport system permease protein
VIRNRLILFGISTFWQGIFVGSFTVIAVAFDRIQASRDSDD